MGPAIIPAVAAVAGAALSSRAQRRAADSASDASLQAASTQASAQREALEFLKEREAIPQFFREEALKQLGAEFGIPFGPQPTFGTAQTIPTARLISPAAQGITKQASFPVAVPSGGLPQNAAFNRGPSTINPNATGGELNTLVKNLDPAVRNSIALQIGREVSAGTLSQANAQREFIKRVNQQGPQITQSTNQALLARIPASQGKITRTDQFRGLQPQIQAGSSAADLQRMLENVDPQLRNSIALEVGRDLKAGLIDQTDVQTELVNRINQQLSNQNQPFGGITATSPVAQRALQSPLFTTGRQTAEEAVLRNAAATGGLRSGNVQDALARANQDLFARSFQQQLGGLQSLANLPSNVNQIAGLTSGIGSTLAQGGLASAQARIQGGLAQDQLLGDVIRIGGSVFGGGTSGGFV